MILSKRKNKYSVEVESQTPEKRLLAPCEPGTTTQMRRCYMSYGTALRTCIYCKGYNEGSESYKHGNMQVKKIVKQLATAETWAS